MSYDAKMNQSQGNGKQIVGMQIIRRQSACSPFTSVPLAAFGHVQIQKRFKGGSIYLTEHRQIIECWWLILGAKWLLLDLISGFIQTMLFSGIK